MATVSVLVAYQLTLAKVGGGTENYEVALFENSTEITKTNVSFPAITSAGLTGVYNGGLVTINPLDTFTLKVRSIDGAATDVNVTDLTLLMTKS